MGFTAGLEECGKSPPPPLGIRSPDRPARSDLLYRLSYPAARTDAKQNTNASSLRAMCAVFKSPVWPAHRVQGR